MKKMVRVHLTLPATRSVPLNFELACGKAIELKLGCNRLIQAGINLERIAFGSTRAGLRSAFGDVNTVGCERGWRDDSEQNPLGGEGRHGAVTRAHFGCQRSMRPDLCIACLMLLLKRLLSERLRKPVEVLQERPFPMGHDSDKRFISAARGLSFVMNGR